MIGVFCFPTLTLSIYGRTTLGVSVKLTKHCRNKMPLKRIRNTFCCSIGTLRCIPAACCSERHVGLSFASTRTGHCLAEGAFFPDRYGARSARGLFRCHRRQRYRHASPSCRRQPALMNAGLTDLSPTNTSILYVEQAARHTVTLPCFLCRINMQNKRMFACSSITCLVNDSPLVRLGYCCPRIGQRDCQISLFSRYRNAPIS